MSRQTWYWHKPFSLSHSCQMIVFGHPGISFQEYVDNFTVPLSSKCSTCSEVLCLLMPLLCLPSTWGMVCHPWILFCRSLALMLTFLTVWGVVYFSNEYFTACMMTNTGTVWFHDGMLTGSSSGFFFDSWGCWGNGNGLNWYLPPTTQLPVMENHWCSLVYESQDLATFCTDRAILAIYVHGTPTSL